MSIYDEIDDMIQGLSAEMTQEPLNVHYIGFLLWRLKTKTDVMRRKENLDIEALRVLQKVIGLASAGIDVRKQLHDFAEMYKDNWQLN